MAWLGKTPRTGRSPRASAQSERAPPRKSDCRLGDGAAADATGGARNSRATSVASITSARTTVGSPRAVAARTASDVFEVVADGNAEMLEELIAFSGAKHLCELRSKRQEDYGRNLLHCAVANGQFTTLQVLLKQKVFDPNQVGLDIGARLACRKHESCRNMLHVYVG